MGYRPVVGETRGERQPARGRTTQQSLRICIVASSRFPIREPFAGGLESHTYSLARGLHRRGHEVSVFAAPGSDVGFPVGTLEVSSYQGSDASRADVAAPPAVWMQEHHAYLTLMLALARERCGDFDLVLNNSLHHLPVAMAPSLRIPVVTTLHTPPVPWLESAIDVAGGAGTFVAVSRAMTRAWCHAVSAVTILNGVDPDRWTAGPGGEDAVWSGRIVPEKAPHEAVDAVRRTGRAISLAGPVLDARVLRTRDPTATGTGRPLRRAPRPTAALRSRRLVRGGRHHSAVGRAVRARGRRGHGVRHPRRGLRPRRPARDRHPASGRLAVRSDVEALAEAVQAAATCDRAAVRRHAVLAHGVTRMLDEYEALFEVTLSAGAA